MSQSLWYLEGGKRRSCSSHWFFGSPHRIIHLCLVYSSKLAGRKKSSNWASSITDSQDLDKLCPKNSKGISRDMGSAAEGQDSREPACQDSISWKLAPNMQKTETTFMTLTLWPWSQYGMLTLSIPAYFMNMIKIEGHQDCQNRNICKNRQTTEMTFVTLTLTLWPWGQYRMLTLSIPTYDLNMSKIEGH